MRMLLDTHVFLWVLNDDKRIAPIIENIIAEDSEVFFSSASFWELAIKASNGRFPSDLKAIRTGLMQSGFRELPVTSEHTLSVISLPVIHKDPFDRLLLCQAMTEPMKLITADSQLEKYQSDVILMI